MSSILFKDNGELNSIIIDYYNYLLVNNFESEKSFDYIFYLLDNLNIYKDNVETLSFNNCLKSNGIYLSDNKKIVLYLSRINGCLNLGIKEKDEIVIAYLNLLFHEITHAYQKLYKENYNNEISEIF